MNYLEVAIDAAKKAEKIILRYYSDHIRVTLKPDQTPVTIADKESEEIIIQTIKKAFPAHGFLGEESHGTNDQNEFVWIIDPIDGTKNYIKQIPIFGTQIALMHKGQLIVGISNAPALKELAYAEKGGGAYINAQKIQVSTVSSLEEATLSTGNLNYFTKIQKENNMINLINAVERDRAYGDFWQYHLLAAGKIDIVVEADIKIWDVAAMKVIIEEAGGKVTDMFGNPINPDSTTIIASNGLLHQKTLKYFN